jgi:5,10-methylenetetrahydrofolate reductase
VRLRGQAAVMGSSTGDAARPEAEPGCPKRMVYGPCGGVRADSSCEMAPHPCPFTERAPLTWSGETEGDDRRDLAAAMDLAGIGAPASGAGSGSLLATAATRPVVLTDFTVRPYDPVSVAEVTRALVGSCDVLLVGEHNNRPDFPPALLVPMIRQAGGRSWVTLTCRDRNRVVLEQEVAALAALDSEGVLCVTGDGRGVGVRPGVTSVFDLDSLRLAATAKAVGLTVAVAESPEAPPENLRPYRLLQKQRAGAQICFLNHVSSAERLGRFVADARAVGVTLPFVAGVAVYTDERSARVLQAFPGLHLDAGRVARVLAAGDPVSAGIDAAVHEAREVLAIPGVVGVNISGLASAAGELAAAKIKATVGREVLGR